VNLFYFIACSVRHAFRGRDHGHVSVILRQEKEDCVLIVEDDGIGMPDMEMSSASSLGFRIVHNIFISCLIRISSS